MSILLEDMVSELVEDAPARNGVPSEAQYERMVKDAVRDFSRRAGRIKRSTIQIVAGTATYDLAADFQKMIKLIGLHAAPGTYGGFGEYGSMAYGGVINSPEGLIPVGPNFTEQYTINGQQITFYPVPRYTLTRHYSYKAAWILIDDDYAPYYDEMGDEEASIVLLKANSLVLDLQANMAAGDGWKYQIGDEMVDKSTQQDAYTTRVKAADDQYLQAVALYNGNTGMVG